MRTAKILTFILAAVLISLVATTALAKDAYTVKTMAQNVNKIQGQEITVEGTIVGACKSGCKIWIADGKYTEGDLVTLVRAKDDAFKFDTKKHGSKVKLTGFVMAKFKDSCSDKAETAQKEQKKSGEAKSCCSAQAKAPAKEGCAAPVKGKTATKEDLGEMTFFATTVKYLD